MASILKVDDLRGNTAAGNITITSEGGSATMQLQQGLAKVFSLYDAVAQTVDDSLNQSSLTDSATGVFIHNFNNNFSARGCPAGMTNRRTYYDLHNADSITTSTVKVSTDQSADTAIDRAENSTVVHGDLA